MWSRVPLYIRIYRRYLGLGQVGGSQENRAKGGTGPIFTIQCCTEALFIIHPGPCAKHFAHLPPVSHCHCFNDSLRMCIGYPGNTCFSSCVHAGMLAWVHAWMLVWVLAWPVLSMAPLCHAMSYSPRVPPMSFSMSRHEADARLGTSLYAILSIARTPYRALASSIIMDSRR